MVMLGCLVVSLEGFVAIRPYNIDSTILGQLYPSKDCRGIIMSEQTEELERLSQEALSSDEKLKELIESLSGPSRRERQTAAAALALVAQTDISRVVPYHAELVDALNRPESQTRWECLDILTLIVPEDSRVCDKALPGAETALFDEKNGPVRLAAMRFMCKLGATTEARSERIWPFIDEGIQCYHGDLEYQDMLSAVVEFSQGKLSDEVKKQLANRVQFDSENGRGWLKRKSQAILDNVK